MRVVDRSRLGTPANEPWMIPVRRGKKKKRGWGPSELAVDGRLDVLLRAGDWPSVCRACAEIRVATAQVPELGSGRGSTVPGDAWGTPGQVMPRLASRGIMIARDSQLTGRKEPLARPQPPVLSSSPSQLGHVSILATWFLSPLHPRPPGYQSC